ncbi:hypothetical protein [Paenisporosarcina indica]|uniref:hypothetical protein n=1 Tax=Paenisporosarcina indica TaxID=650093 RepID=UPI0009501191|nr:hypothetical protein [Paenisporosarcina indica]
MKKLLLIFLVLMTFLASCGNESDLSKEAEAKETEKGRTEAKEDKQHTYKEGDIVLGQPIDFTVMNFLTPESVAITINDMKLAKVFPMSEELKEIYKKDRNTYLDTQAKLLYEMINYDHDHLIINLSFVNKTTIDLQPFNKIKFVVENVNGMQVEVDMLMEQEQKIQTFENGILSPEGSSDGVFVLEIPEGTEIDKMYMMAGDGNSRDYSDIYYINPEDIEKIEEYSSSM